MEHLVHFSLTYDCTDDIVRVLTRNCPQCLRILDVEYSIRVTDRSVNDIVECQNLLQLHIFHTGLSLSGKAYIIKTLRSLRLLFRGDFLCDA
jgi:hypothetical protein